MVKNELYQPLADKIMSLVPRLKELNNGCEIKLSFNNPDMRTVRVIDSDDVKVLTRQVSPKLEHNDSQVYFRFRSDINKDQVIGHPITLEDVLGASDGLGFSNGFIYNFENSNYKWQYGKHLQDQSDELGEFLSDILL